MSFQAEIFMPAAENNNKFWNLARKSEGLLKIQSDFPSTEHWPKALAYYSGAASPPVVS